MPSPLTGHADNSLRASAQWFCYILDAISWAGLDAAAIADEVGLDQADLSNPEATVSDEYSHLLLAAATRHSGDADFALRAAKHQSVTALGALGYAMMSSADLRSALKLAVHYSTALTQAVSCQIQVSNGQCRVEFPVKPYTPQVARQPQEFMVTAVLTYMNWLVGRPLRLKEVAFMHPRPKSIDRHIDAFGLVPVFSAAHPAISFEESDLDLPVVTADQSIAPLHQRFAEERSLSIGHPTHIQQTRRCIISALANGKHAIIDISRQLNISERSLQRHLSDEGTNFNTLLDSIRRDLLVLYLRDSQMPFKEVATRLGFASHSSFSRAVRRWHGKSPATLRR